MMPDDGGAPRAIERMRAALRTLWSGGGAREVKELCSQKDDVSAFLGLGGYEQGWEQVSRRWDWAGQQFRGGGPFVFENLSTLVTADMACTTEIERIRVQLDGAEQQVDLANRVTQVFRREDGEWKLVHRHASRLEAQRTGGAQPPARGSYMSAGAASADEQPASSGGPGRPLGPGDPAPDFELPALHCEGNVSLADYRGRKPLLLVMLRGLY